MILFSKKDNEHPIKVTIYSLLLILLLSISIGVISIQANIDYNYSGELGGQVADFFIDMFSIYGCILFLITCYLMLIRAYFDLDYYKPIITSKEKFILWKSEYLQNRDKFRKEDEKRKHTQELKSKIKIDKGVNALNDNATKDSDKKSNVGDSGNQNNEKQISHNDQDSGDESIDNIEGDDSENKEPIDSIKSPGIKETTETTEEDLHIEEMVENAEIDIDEIEDRQKPKKEGIFI